MTSLYSRPPAFVPAPRRRPIWLLYRSADMANAVHAYSNRRLIDSAARAGLATEVLHPRRVRRDVFEGPGVPRPVALLGRAGTRHGGAGKRLLAAAEAKGIVTLPQSAALRRSENKLSVGQVLTAAGVPTPASAAITAETSTDWLGDRFGFPLVLKNAIGSKGRQVTLCRNPAEFAERFAEVVGRGQVLAQRYVRRSHGRDLRVVVIGGVPVAAMLRRAAGDQLCANIYQGATANPTPITAEMAAIAVAATHALGLDVAGVDLLFDESGLTVCEVNTAPGFEAIEQATGRDIAGAVIAHLLRRLATEPALPQAASG